MIPHPRTSPLLSITLLLLTLTASLLTPAAQAEDRPPNIVYIMSDELAYYELSHMGNPYIHTPNIDRMAKQGIRFTQALAGAPVCAPLRASLMTGKHMGHASVRANDGGTPLRADETTIATMLKQKNYATGGYGKWGAGGRGSTGVPEKHGFDEFVGYYDQVHAHSFYPAYIIKNSKELELPGNEGGRSGDTYSHYVIMDHALDFIRKNKDRPFFCYLPITPPHGMYDIPSTDPAWTLYNDDDWIRDTNISQDVKNYAAMVTMVDRNVGMVLDLLKELNLDENTIVFFTGDNGGQDRFRSKQNPRGFFGPNVNPKTGVEFRGGKGNLYEGGLRIPFIVRWPGKIKPGTVSPHLFYQPDVMPTLAQLTGTTPPKDIDGISFLPTLLNTGNQKQHEYLYWEFGQQTAVRINHWKAIKTGKAGKWRLYNLVKDVSEVLDISADHPDIIAQAKAYAQQAHEPVRPGTYSDRSLHEQDRRAKWGTSNAGGAPKPKASPKFNAKNLIPPHQMQIVSFSSENLPNHKHAKNAIDGNASSLWHTNFTGTINKHPHEIVIDLGANYNITEILYLARQDGGWNGAFGKTEIYVSNSPKDFDKPARITQFGKVRKPQSAKLPQNTTGRYLKLRILSEVNDGPWASAAEIGVVGTKAK